MGGKSELLAISVILPIYKEPINWISKAIDSILNQTFSNFELIIINDSPLREENDLFVLELMKQDLRIKYIKNESNLGITASLNKGLDLAKGKYIARMDADDISMLKRFEMQYDFMEKNQDVVLCGASATLINAKNKVIGERFYPSKNEDIREMLILENCIIHPTFFFKRSIVDLHKIRYSEEYPCAEDYDFINKISDLGKLHNLKEKLIDYRISNTQTSTSKIKIQIKSSDKVQRELLIKTLNNINGKELIEIRDVSTVVNECLFRNNKDQLMLNIQLSSFLCFEKRSLKDVFLVVFSFKYSLRDSLKIIIKKLS